MLFSKSRKSKRAGEIHASRETWRTREVRGVPKITRDFTLNLKVFIVCCVSSETRATRMCRPLPYFSPKLKATCSLQFEITKDN